MRQFYIWYWKYSLVKYFWWLKCWTGEILLANLSRTFHHGNKILQSNLEIHFFQEIFLHWLERGREVLPKKLYQSIVPTVLKCIWSYPVQTFHVFSVHSLGFLEVIILYYCLSLSQYVSQSKFPKLQGSVLSIKGSLYINTNYMAIYEIHEMTYLQPAFS